MSVYASNLCQSEHMLISRRQPPHHKPLQHRVKSLLGQGLHRGSRTYQIIINRRTINPFIIQRSHSTREFSTPMPMTSLSDLVGCREVRRTNNPKASGGKQMMRKLKRFEYDQLWLLPFDSRVSAKEGSSRLSSTAVTRLHLLLRLIISMHHRCSNQPQPVKHTNNMLTKIKYHDPGTILILQNTRMVGSPSPTTPILRIPPSLIRLHNLDWLLKQPNLRHNMSTARTST